MSIWGKVIGGAAGFALGGPLGALLGGVAGHLYDSYRDDRGDDAATDGDGEARAVAESQVGFTIAVIALGAKLAKADRVVTEDEIRAFRRVFHVPPEEVGNVARVFNLARRSTHGYQSYAHQIAGMFDGRPALLEELLDCLFYIARADGEVSEGELDYLAEVAHILGFSDAEFGRIRVRHIGPDRDDPYTVLGVDREAGDDEVKAAWRKLVREHHPDRLVAQGLPHEFVAMAEDKLKAVNAAWDQIAKHRGIG
ncbi:MAG: molecular chaperone DjiA [Alphaproteobacteria bacterium]|nr:molecular chaperone DjiA [Alphaproteobacteria bacterium]